MSYFLTVKTKAGDYARRNERHPDLDAALKVISERYLRDAAIPYRWSGYFALRSGELTFLKIKSGTAGDDLREDIAEINLLSERGYLERDTNDDDPRH